MKKFLAVAAIAGMILAAQMSRALAAPSTQATTVALDKAVAPFSLPM